MLAQSTFNKRDLTVDVVRDILGKMVKKPTEELTVDKIQEVVCEHFNIPSELLQTKTRKREVVQARQLAMYFCKNYTKYSSVAKSVKKIMLRSYTPAKRSPT